MAGSQADSAVFSVRGEARTLSNNMLGVSGLRAQDPSAHAVPVALQVEIPDDGHDDLCRGLRQ